MDPKTVQEQRHDLQILDVREDDEWIAGRIEGSRHIPLGELSARLGERPEPACGDRVPQRWARQQGRRAADPGRVDRAHHVRRDHPVGGRRPARQHAGRASRPGGLTAHNALRHFRSEYLTR